MSHNHSVETGGQPGGEKEFSPEEEAILGGAKNSALRKVFEVILRVKVRLQFTGWLQYIPFGILTLIFFLGAGLARLLGYTRAANPIALVGFLLLAALTFDLVTVKFRIRPPEQLPERKDDLDIFDLMRARRSCRSFQLRNLTSAHYNELMESVRLHSEAPMIGKAPVRFEYLSAPLTVWPVVNATEFLVAIVPKEYNRHAVIDVGRSLQKIVVDATRIGLATCWIGPGADHDSIKMHLGDRFDSEKEHIICVCAVGYRSNYIPIFLRIFNRQLSRRRLPLSSLFFTDPQFSAPLQINAPPFNRFGRNYEICQWAPSSYNGQTTRCVAVSETNVAEIGLGTETEPRLKRFDFYAVTESRYYAPVAVGIWCANWEMGCEALGIPGHLDILSLDDGNNSLQPRYDVSWVLDGSGPYLAADSSNLRVAGAAAGMTPLKTNAASWMFEVVSS